MIPKTIAMAALIALPTTASAQQTCFTWESNPGGAVMSFHDESWEDFTLTLADGTVRVCDTRQSGMRNPVKQVQCDDDLSDGLTPLFFVAFDPDEPLGDAALVLGTVPYYPACE